MSDTQWEFCELRLRPQTTTSRECVLWYYHPAVGVVRRPAETLLPERDEVFAFERVMALLGRAGWELVAVQHDLSYEFSYRPGEAVLESATSYAQPNRVVYFKRLRVPDRGLEEPWPGSREPGAVLAELIR